jgi:FkbH-like protein
MTLTATPIDELSLARVTQLIHKTNQFNLTTWRLTEAEVRATVDNPACITLQVRLKDRFGDNGIIAVLIARARGATGQGGADATIEVFLMSCRVLGRRVEEACMNALVEACEARGVKRLNGLYRPTPKNAIVRDLYASLGFAPIAADSQGETTWSLAVSAYTPRVLPIEAETLREALV